MSRPVRKTLGDSQRGFLERGDFNCIQVLWVTDVSQTEIIKFEKKILMKRNVKFRYFVN